MTEPRDRTSPARRRMLDAAYELLSTRGVGNASLRELAAALNTSHRMLIYHFGSREGLLAQVVELTEQRQREALADLTTASQGRPGDVARDFWRRLTDPALAPAERLFFEMYGQALQGRPWAAGMLPGVVEEWLPYLTELFSENGAIEEKQAAARARMALAMARGLLLDLLGTGDEPAVEAAFQEFISLLPPPPQAPAAARRGA